MNRMYKWQFHFNAMHNMTPEKEENKHTHSFLVVLWMKVFEMSLEKQNLCEKALKSYIEQYNGKYLNELDKFQGKIPTIENVCETLYYDTEKIAATYGMEQIQMEVGDSPIALFVMGRKLLLGGTGHLVADDQFAEYKQHLRQ